MINDAQSQSEDSMPDDPRARLEHLRGELRAERISYGELAELESLREYIEPHDVELLEAAGVSEDEYRRSTTIGELNATICLCPDEQVKGRST